MSKSLDAGLRKTASKDHLPETSIQGFQGFQDKLRDHLGLVQGWESDVEGCWGFPYSKNKNLFMFYLLFFHWAMTHDHDLAMARGLDPCAMSH